MTDRAGQIELTILMPCLNEAETLAGCIERARNYIDRSGTSAEIVISDNGSTDGSREIAKSAGARVVEAPVKGYGEALRSGIEAASGRFVIFGDADGSYDFEALDPFVEKLRDGFDLVMGNRFAGGIAKGAMPALHRYVGNPILSLLGRTFFRSSIGDFHCGLRGVSREAARKMDLQTSGMEFASEMVVKASLLGMKVAEVPTTLSPDGRSRAPHLRTWRDGWRHLRFMLIYSPRWLFLYPGLLLMLLGAFLGALTLPGPFDLGFTTIDIHTLVYGATMIATGYQLVLFAVLVKAYGISTGLLPHDKVAEAAFARIKLETGIVVGVVLLAVGLGLAVYALATWGSRGLGPLDVGPTMRLVIPSSLLLMLGTQTIFSSFFLSVLGMRRRSTAN